jgi:hypothetical protein
MKLANIKPISYLESEAARIVTELSESAELDRLDDEADT